MGQAIIIKNINFSSFNLGTVHRQGQPIPVTGISILGDSIVTNSATYSVVYTPSITTQLGVTWSIVSGSTYATIDSQTGELTVLDGASSNNVKIRATSIFNQSIYGELDIVVSYVVHDCSMEVSLINGDFTLHDWDNGVDIEPVHAGYLASNSEGTSFNRTVGHGILYSDNNNIYFKSVSFEAYFDTTKTGNLSNTWGGIFQLAHRGNSASETLIIINKPDNGYRAAIGANASQENIDTTVQQASLGTWHKICLSTDFDESKKFTSDRYNLRLCVDGVDLGQINTSYDGLTNQLGDDYIVIGNSGRLFYNGVTSTDINPMCGKVKNVRLFRRQLTSQEAINESTLN